MPLNQTLLTRAFPLIAMAMSLPASTAAASDFTISFGSCARERLPQPIWTEVLATDPDVFLFIGDNQYADVFYRDGRRVMAPVDDIERIREAYRDLDAKSGFRRLRRAVPLMATWDDHDYGANDAGTEYALKEESKQAFFDFYGFRENDPIREQPGVYNARVFTEEVAGEAKRVQVIMLDTRFNRDSLDRKDVREPGLGSYRPTEITSKTMLGEEQWEWLEAELRKPADVRVIASSIQVVAWEHGYETWGNMPHERQRLYDLIDETDAAGVVFVSGDRHLMEISRDASGWEGAGVPYTMWDFTSSGMTERPRPVSEPNSYRVGPVLRETNFGVIEIDWTEDGSDASIDLVGLGDQGQMLTRQTVWLSDLAE